MRRMYVRYWALGSAALMVLGGLAPWATLLGFSAGGGQGDALLIVLCGAAALGLSASTRFGAAWPALAGALLAGVALVVAATDLSDLSSFSSLRPDVTWSVGAIRPGWGLYLSVAASASTVLAGLATAILARPARVAGSRGPAAEQGG